PVAERDQLPEAAWLEAGGHEEQIGACVDPLRKSGVESQGEREMALVLGGKRAPLRLVRRVACAEDDELPAPLKQPRGDRGQKIHALLLDEASDDPEQRSGRVDAQSGLFLECRLVGGLSALVVRAVVRGNVRVVRRVEELRVDAVRDAPEIGATLL